MTEYGLDEEQNDEFREAFSVYDKGQGSVDARNFGFVMRYMGQNPSDAEVSDMLAKYGSGMAMPLNGFLKMMGDKLRDVQTEDGIIESFQVFDKDGKGYVSAAELRNILTNMGDKLSDEQVNQMMSEALSSDDGNLDYKQFVHMMMNR